MRQSKLHRQLPNKIGTLLLGFTLACLCGNAAASFKRFEAPMDESKWQFQGNPLHCSLIHSIPYYGDAEFAKHAGKGQKLLFQLGYKRQRLQTDSVAAVRSIAPVWQPLTNSRDLGQIKVQHGNAIIRSEDNATWRLLNELEVGRYPTFFYQDFSEMEDQVAVALSSIGFKPQYDQFLDCLAGLVPYRLEELSNMTLYFDFDKSTVQSKYRDRLSALSEYIRYDPDIEVVFINGFTDSKGPRYYNQKLSERRVASVKGLLSQEGIAPERFKTAAFGEKFPAATNRNAKGRSLNRRVVIRIEQNR